MTSAGTDDADWRKCRQNEWTAKLHRLRLITNKCKVCHKFKNAINTASENETDVTWLQVGPKYSR